MPLWTKLASVTKADLMAYFDEAVTTPGAYWVAVQCNPLNEVIANFCTPWAVRL